MCNFNEHSVDKLYFWEQNMNMFFQKYKAWRQISFIVSSCYTRALIANNIHPEEEFPTPLREIVWKWKEPKFLSYLWNSEKFLQSGISWLFFRTIPESEVLHQ